MVLKPGSSTEIVISFCKVSPGAAIPSSRLWRRWWGALPIRSVKGSQYHGMISITIPSTHRQRVMSIALWTPSNWPICKAHFLGNENHWHTLGCVLNQEIFRRSKTELGVDCAQWPQCRRQAIWKETLNNSLDSFHFHWVFTIQKKKKNTSEDKQNKKT